MILKITTKINCCNNKFLAFLLFFSSLFISFQKCYSQFSTVQWEQSFGGSGDDQCFSLTKTVDGGYTLVGYSASMDGDISSNNGGEDFWMVHLDGNGSFQWEQSLGGSNYDVARSVFATKDSGYVLAGYSWSKDGFINFGENHGLDDYWLVKMDEFAGVEWQIMLGGEGNDEANSVIQTSDGGFLVVGNSNSTTGDVTNPRGGFDYWVVKINSSGVKQWQKSFGGSGDDFATSVVQTSDGGYVVAGYTASHDSDVTANYGYNDYWIVKLDTAGHLLWQKNYGGSSDDKAFSIIQTSDHGFAIAGVSSSTDFDVTGNHGTGDYWILKLDSIGAIKWQNSFGGSSYDEATAIIQTNDGGYAISGKSFSNDGNVSGNNGNSDYWVIKLDSMGIIHGQQSFGGSDAEKSPSIVQASDGSYVVAGTSSSNDKDVSGNHGGNDFWVVKLSSSIGIEEETNKKLVKVVPNPSSGKFRLYGLQFAVIEKVELFDLIGQNFSSYLSIPILSKQTLSSEGEDNMVEFNANVPSGIYFLHIITNNGEIVRKLAISG